MLISIYPIANGKHREVKANANISAGGPFDSPAIIAGWLVDVPSIDEFREIQSNEVLFEGEVYRFDVLQTDGAFELKKAW